MFRPLLISMFLTSTALADTWTVDDDGKADFDNIQAAVDAASSLPNHDDILVYPGIYPAGIDMLGKEVWLHSSDGPEVTVIDGGETQHGIVCASGETFDTVIEGFTISNCYGGWPVGGGMGITNESSATVVNCIFDSNVTDGNGGGMNVVNGSVNISGCLFVNNRTAYDYYPGGGIGIYSANGGDVVITDTRFCDNWPNAIMGEWTDGGGTCIAFSCTDSDGDGVPDECGTVGDGAHYVPEEYATIQEAILAAGDRDEIIVGPGTYDECGSVIPESFLETVINPLGKRLWIHSSDGPAKTFIDGDCPGTWTSGGETSETIIEGFTFAGGDYASARLFLSSSTFKNCIFTGEWGFLVRGGSPTFESCSFVDITLSTALSFEDYHGSPKVYNCTFKGNCQRAINKNDQSGMNHTIEIMNCLFEDNGSIDNGCGPDATVYMSGSNSEIMNCIFRNNQTQGGTFGGITLQGWQTGNLSMSNCLFEDNTNAYSFFYYPETYESHLGTIHASEFKNNSGTGIGLFLIGNTLTIEDCLIKENAIGGIDNYLSCTNLSLIDTVVCSNGGYQIDCEDWIDGGGNTIAEVCFDDCQASDITGDGIVDVSDILAVLGYWGSSIPAGDVDGNGVVDIGDLLMVVGNWGPCE